MYTSLTELFKIGIGPSSSHTVGPMRAAADFIRSIDPYRLSRASQLTVILYGSLAWTGQGHATDRAIVLGLAGYEPRTVEPEEVEAVFQSVSATGSIVLPNGHRLAFQPQRDIVFDRVRTFPRHPNAMSFAIRDADQAVLAEQLCYSIGGGFIELHGAQPQPGRNLDIAYRYSSARELLDLASREHMPIAQIVLANERAWRPDAETHARIEEIAEVMLSSIDRGLRATGSLPGPLRVRRRAASLYERLGAASPQTTPHATRALDHISAYAIAVNEENASGGRVVTAPTNGAAGVIPAVLRYYLEFCADASRQGVHTFFLAATAIGGLIKRNASISGAEAGCQGEVGSAAAMAAAGLAAALGASNEQIENAAEIALEHHLGMTCDPVGGLVQIPCIERNAFGAVKAVNAASLALAGDGSHHVSLDQAIETMRQTGADMNEKYKETSRGGLAVNVPAC